MTVGGTVRGERIGDGQWTSELPLGLEVCMRVLEECGVLYVHMRCLHHIHVLVTQSRRS